MKNITWLRKKILYWYKNNGRHFPWRKKSCTNYQLIISEVLLQRTKAETVACFYKEFIATYPSWRTLAEATEKELQSILKPIGLWRQRSKAIKKLSREMAKRNGRFPKTREEIEQVPAVGQYIANAVLMFCHDQPQPLLDVNMARVLERIFGPRKLADIRYDPHLQELSRKVTNTKNAKELNWAILDFAAIVCKTKNPLCNGCILKSKCKYYKRIDKKIKGIRGN